MAAGRAGNEGYGTPLRLRVENQLGYKMIERIERIELIESKKQAGEGEGGKNEVDELLHSLTIRNYLTLIYVPSSTGFP